MEENKYIRITTYSKDKRTVAKISTEVIKEKYAASTHIDKVLSSYWWDGKVEDTEEYRLEIITRKDKEDIIVQTIKLLHDYDVPEIQIDEHNTLNKDIENWIDDILDK
jgi:periplasmic divalent cation tolerance protein